MASWPSDLTVKPLAATDAAAAVACINDADSLTGAFRRYEDLGYGPVSTKIRYRLAP